MTSPTWNEIPYDPYASPEVKGDEFEKQWTENQAAGDAKEQAGQYRPEPGMK